LSGFWLGFAGVVGCSGVRQAQTRALGAGSWVRPKVEVNYNLITSSSMQGFQTASWIAMKLFLETSITVCHCYGLKS